MELRFGELSNETPLGVGWSKKLPLLISVIVGSVDCCFCFVNFGELQRPPHHHLCLS
jgi:hypothetical protein